MITIGDRTWVWSNPGNPVLWMGGSGETSVASPRQDADGSLKKPGI
jgi:hypothetical protein